MTRSQIGCEHKKAMADGPNILCADCAEPFTQIAATLRRSTDIMEGWCDWLITLLHDVIGERGLVS